MRRAIRENYRDVIGIVLLAALAITVGLVILFQQRASFPEWVPGVGEDRFELRAELTTAKAVTPGQGQTVHIAGATVGDITGVELEEGNAVITMALDSPYEELLHPDASILVRPRTGLQDMTIELDLGTEPGSIPDGFTIPLSQTAPNVNVDEILATLDADTRSYLKLLLNGGGDGLAGRSQELSAGLRRLEPTIRDLARINAPLAKRRQNVRRAVHSFSLLAEELGRGEQELSAFVDSSSSVLGAFAEQEVAIREALRELPSTLSETRGALTASARLSRELTPALTELVPAAEALGPALKESRPFFKQTLAPIRDQLRPTSREIRKPVKHVKGLSKPLAPTTDGLKSGWKDLNRLLNLLAFNPEGQEEGYLFWFSWLNHNANAEFTIQDAQGPIRRGVVLQSCETARLAEGVAALSPVLKTLLELTRQPDTDDLCSPPVTQGP
jgi:phospholipid/cholesterol/gamma-HCH transport system substrate-binding protein